jgi:membrane protein DedA with SNARE-associated domain
LILALNDWVPMLAGSPWVYLALFAFAAIDGFFPPIPSESVVIALASLSIAHGEPNILLVALAGAAGAFTGDQVAYLIGSKVDVRRLRIFRTGRGSKALDWAEHALVHRGSSFILAARYIPIGRVAVNMTAGALGYPRRRFMGLTALAAVTWAAYGTLIGAGAGVWLADHSLLAVVAGVVVGTVVGLAIDWALRRWTRVGETPTRLGGAREEAGTVAEPTVAVDAPEAAPAAPVTSRQRSGPGR